MRCRLVPNFASQPDSLLIMFSCISFMEIWEYVNLYTTTILITLIINIIILLTQEQSLISIFLCMLICLGESIIIILPNVFRQAIGKNGTGTGTGTESTVLHKIIALAAQAHPAFSELLKKNRHTRFTTLFSVYLSLAGLLLKFTSIVSIYMEIAEKERAKRS
ncbi:hypothetical protein ACJX0J_027896 [Zea mays]